MGSGTLCSPEDNQPCMDHDRQAGEGVGPLEYTLIKLRLLAPLPAKIASAVGQSPVFLVAATPAPGDDVRADKLLDTSDIRYIGARLKSGEVWVCTRRAARNMAHQEFFAREGTIDEVFEVQGSDLIGCGLHAPLTSYEKVFVLPMMTIKEAKGTGVVTRCVTGCRLHITSRPVSIQEC